MLTRNAVTEVTRTLRRRCDDDTEDMMISLSGRASQMEANALT
jgi:hypothetical protein